MNASDLKHIAQMAKIDKRNKYLKGIAESTAQGIEHFTESLQGYAEKGLFKKKTTCLVRSNDHDQNKYYCQTGTGGEGFTILDIHPVIEGIEKMGFTVNFVSKSKGYSQLDISWE
jgi:hypothetical protein